MTILVLTTQDRLDDHPAFEKIFRARAAVFHDRLGWAVNVIDGREIDRCDDHEDPVYLATQDSSGLVTGSLRLLPPTAETMLRNEFRSWFDAPVDIYTSTAWECTKFCIHPVVDRATNASRATAVELLDGLCNFALKSGIEHIVGVYDAAMTGVYRRHGWSPEPLARSRPEFGNNYVGLWTVSEAISRELSRKLKVRQARSIIPITDFETASTI